MKLNPRARKIVRTVALNADATNKELSQMINCPEHVVRYELDKLLGAGILNRTAFIDPYALGFCFYDIYFSINSNKSDLKQAFVQTLIESPQVIFLGEVGGDFQYDVGISCRESAEVNQFLEKLNEKYSNIFFEKTISVRLRLSLFTRKYLSSTKPKVEQLKLGGLSKRIEISPQEKKILSAFSNVNHKSKRDIARATNIPLSTFEARVRNLKEKGIIKGFIYEVRPDLYDVQQYKLLIYAKGVDPERTRKLENFALNHPNIVIFIECLGDWEYELSVEVEKANEITELTQQVYQEFGDSLTSIKVVPVFNRLKFSLFPF